MKVSHEDPDTHLICDMNVSAELPKEQLYNVDMLFPAGHVQGRVSILLQVKIKKE